MKGLFDEEADHACRDEGQPIIGGIRDIRQDAGAAISPDLIVRGSIVMGGLSIMSSQAALEDASTALRRT
jgi:hypothetical protein